MEGLLMEHNDKQAEQHREKLQAEHEFKTERLTEKFASILNDNEILGCVKYKGKLYWKKAKLPEDTDGLERIWKMLRVGLQYTLEKIGHFPKREGRVY